MTAPDVNADVRARFEARVRQWPNYSERTLVRDGRYPDYYGNPVVQGAWEGYRAAHADLSGDPRSESGSSEKVAQWLYANGYREAAATIRTRLDVRNKRIADLAGEVWELVEALQAARDHGAMTGDEWVIDKVDAALAKFHPTHQEKP